METTKEFIKNYWKIIAGITTVWLAILGFAGGKLIDYYCNSSIPFFGFRLYVFVDACPVYISFGYIVITAIAIFLIGLIVSTVLDSFRLKTERIFQLDANKPMTYMSNTPRWASIKITNVSGEILKNCFVDLVGKPPVK